jgi:NAD(P)H dehydrogenase (quinone)
LLKRYSSSLAVIKPKILVTGATGKTGGAVVTELLAKGWPVRAAVRVRDARSDRLQRRGAEIVVVDIFDPNQLMDAMRGVQRAYYCPPYHPFVIQSASAFAVAARETGLEQIVGLSQWLAGPNHPALMTRQQWLIDRMFAALPNIAHTAVTPGFFADSPFLEMMPMAAHLGIFYKAAKAQGKQPILLSGLKHYFQDQDRGAFAIGAPNDTVHRTNSRYQIHYFII